MKQIVGHTLKPNFLSLVKKEQGNVRMENNIIRILKARSSKELEDITEDELVYILEHFEEVEDFMFRSGIFNTLDLFEKSKNLPRVARRRIL